MHITSGSDALKQYQQIATTITLDDASPHRLIQLLMEHALKRISFARGHMERGEVEKKGKAIGDAISVVNGLQASLNHSADKRMSENFDSLYAYMMRRLLEANLNDDQGILSEVSGLLGELKEAWDAIADDPAVVAAQSVQN